MNTDPNAYKLIQSTELEKKGKKMETRDVKTVTVFRWMKFQREVMHAIIDHLHLEISHLVVL